MLRFAEEIMLLLLDDEGKGFLNVPDVSLRYALAGGVLMDLAMEDRIDTDFEQLILVDPTPLDDNILDPVLADIAAATATHDARYWVEQAASNAYKTREAAMERLVARGILERREDRFMWMFRSRRYPLIDGEAELEVKLRIMEVLFADVVPHTPGCRHHMPGRCLRDLHRTALRRRLPGGAAAHRTRSPDGPDRPRGSGRHPRHLANRPHIARLTTTCPCGHATA